MLKIDCCVAELVLIHASTVKLLVAMYAQELLSCFPRLMNAHSAQEMFSQKPAQSVSQNNTHTSTLETLNEPFCPLSTFQK